MVHFEMPITTQESNYTDIIVTVTSIMLGGSHKIGSAISYKVSNCHKYLTVHEKIFRFNNTLELETGFSSNIDSVLASLA